MNHHGSVMKCEISQSILPYKCVLDFYSYIEYWLGILRDTEGMAKQEDRSSMILFRCDGEEDQEACLIFIENGIESLFEKTNISNYSFRFNERDRSSIFTYRKAMEKAKRLITSAKEPCGNDRYYELAISL